MPETHLQRKLVFCTETFKFIPVEFWKSGLKSMQKIHQIQYNSATSVIYIYKIRVCIYIVYLHMCNLYIYTHMHHYGVGVCLALQPPIGKPACHIGLSGFEFQIKVLTLSPILLPPNGHPGRKQVIGSLLPTQETQMESSELLVSA